MMDKEIPRKEITDLNMYTPIDLKENSLKLDTEAERVALTVGISSLPAIQPTSL